MKLTQIKLGLFLVILIGYSVLFPSIISLGLFHNTGNSDLFFHKDKEIESKLSTENKSDRHITHSNSIQSNNNRIESNLSNENSKFSDNDQLNIENGNYIKKKSKLLDQSGSGNSNSIIVNESLNLESSYQVNTSNTFSNATNDDYFQLPSLTDYSKVKGTYFIKNVTATYDYAIIEDSSVFDTLSSKGEGDTRSISTSFTVNVSMINITRIQIAYTTAGNVVLQDTMAYITGISNGLPNETVIGEILNFGKQPNPVTLTYLNPVTLPKGSYALILNDTGYTGAQAYFDWHIAWDNTTINGDGVNESQMWTKNATGNWIIQSADLLFKYEYIEINPENKSETKIFTNPFEVDLSYNSTHLENYSDNLLLINGSIAYFSTNISVCFDLDYKILFNSSLNRTINFFVANNTFPTWNITINQFSIPNGNYQINNRTLQFYELPKDWNASLIYLNESLFSDNLTFNDNIIYEIENSFLLINLTVNVTASVWIINFVSPNYLNEISLFNEKIEDINFPYNVNTSTILQIYTTFLDDSSGENGSILIYDFNNNLNFSSINRPIIENSISFEWQISSNLDFSQNVNGAYTIVIFWKDTSKLKIGYIEININIFGQTELNSTFIDDVIIGNNINLDINYTSAHNQTNLNNANITYIASWNFDNPIAVNQSETFGSYNVSNITTDGAVEGPANITVHANLHGFVNRMQVIFFNLLLNTTLSYNVNTTLNNEIYYQDVIEIVILFQNEFESNIIGATIEINGTITENEQPDHSYIFYYNTSNLDPSTSQFVFNLSAIKDFHISRKILTTNISLLSSPSIVMNLGDTPINNSEIINYYSIDNEDELIISLQFFDIRHFQPISEALLTHNMTTDFADITGDDINLANGTWILSINPLKNGNKSVYFEFNKIGYQNSSFNLKFVILITPSSPIFGGQENWKNDSIINKTFSGNIADQINLSILFKDDFYQKSLYSILTNISDSSYFDFSTVNKTDKTWEIIIFPKQIGNSSLIINFSKPYYKSFVIVINIHSLPVKFEIISGSYNNDNREITVEYQRSTIVEILWKDLVLNIPVNDTSPTINYPDWVVFLQNQLDGTHKFNVSGMSMKTIDINVNFTSSLYEFKIYSLTFSIRVIPLSTNDIVGKYTQGFVLNQNNVISKLGYTLGIELNWSISDNRSLVYSPIFNVYRNSTQINNITNYGISFSSSSSSNKPWTLKLWIFFLPQNHYQRGWYNFTIDLSHYGVVNQTLTNLTMFLKGFDIKIDLEYDDVLIQDAEYTIKAIVTYVNGSLTNGSPNLILLKKITSIDSINTLVQDEFDLFDNATGIPIEFIISIEFENGTTTIFQETTSTNAEGIAFYRISRGVTKEIKVINNISVELTNQEFSEEFYLPAFSPQITIDVLSTQISTEETTTPPDIIDIALIMLLTAFIFIAGFIGFITYYRYHETIKNKIISNQEKLDFISNLIMIVVATSTGLPLYNILQSKYENNPDVVDLLGGVSSNIDMFLESFQSDFLNQIFTKEEVTIDPLDNIRISQVVQNEIQIMIVASHSFRLFLFTRINFPNHVEELFSKIVAKLEGDIQIDDRIVNRTQLKPLIEEIFELYFPLPIIQNFKIDINQLEKYAKDSLLRKQALLSQSTLNSYKYLYLSQVSSLNTVPIKIEDRLQLYGDIIKKKEEIKLNYLHFDEAYRILYQELNLSFKNIFEILWRGSSKELKIIIPYK
ncbi:MAG: hypothetical protein ACXAC7_09440 [Candidatus Hodarchaeales archaeon]|jgi:hypothetical protein